MGRLSETNSLSQNYSKNETVLQDCGVEYYVDLLYKYYIPVMIFIGLIGNILSCLVFLTTYLNMRSSSYYLAALAVADIVFLLLLTLESFGATILPDLFNEEDGWCQAITYAGSVASTLSTWLIVAFTVERFIAIQYPLKRPLICTVSRAKMIVFVLSAVAIISHCYVFWTAGINAEENGCNMLPEQLAAMKIITTIDSIISLFIPILLIVIINVLIARNLFTFGKRVGDSAREERLSLEKSVDSKDSTKVILSFEASVAY